MATASRPVTQQVRTTGRALPSYHSAFPDPLGDVRPEVLAAMTDEERDDFCAHMGRLVGGERLRDFVARVAPHEPIPRHLDPIVDLLEYARLKPIRAVIDYGPGHAKTTMLMRGIAHWLSPDQSPGDLCVYVSYSDNQARSKSRIAKETMEAAGYPLSRDKTSDSHWLTPQGGGLVAAGSRGGVMGKRVPGLLVWDDPYKDMQEARSPAINSMIIERFKGVAFTRLQGGSIIVVHTRYHVDDLIGYILKNLKWPQISVPTVCKKPATDVLCRAEGEVAWPQKYPYELCLEEDGVTARICGHDGHVSEIEATLGPHMFAAMYQGQPRPEGTTVFKEPARFRLYDGIDERTGRQVKSEFSWTGKRGVIGIDPAATASTSADWSVLLVMASEGLGMRTRVWIVDVIRLQVEIPVLVANARRVQLQYRLLVACEAISGFKSVPQTLRSIDPTLRVVDVTTGGKDKFMRAQPLAGAWNDGRVLVPMDAPWADKLIAEFTRFTGVNDREDDQVDAGAHAFNVLYRPARRVEQDDYEETTL